MIKTNWTKTSKNGFDLIISTILLGKWTVSDMPDVAWQIVAVSAWHRFLRRRFFGSKSHL